MDNKKKYLIFYQDTDNSGCDYGSSFNSKVFSGHSKKEAIEKFKEFCKRDEFQIKIILAITELTEEELDLTYNLYDWF